MPICSAQLLQLVHSSRIQLLIFGGVRRSWHAVAEPQGECAERCAEARGFSREAQEDAALESFQRATEAAESGVTAQVCTALLAGVLGADRVVQDSTAHAAGRIMIEHMGVEGLKQELETILRVAPCLTLSGGYPACPA